MNTHYKTLWMGNIEPWMTLSFITSILNELNIFPQRIILKTHQIKEDIRSWNLIPRKQAENILNNFNGKIIHNLQLKFNKVRTFEEKYLAQKIKKFTVSLDKN